MADRELLEDADFLIQKYHSEGLTLAEVGELCECTKENVRHWMGKHGIDTRSKSEAFTDGDVQKLDDAAWLEKQYWKNGLSCKEIGESLDLSWSTVRQAMQRHDISRRTDAEQMTDGDVEKLNDKEFLKREYWENGKTSQEIADDINVAQQSVIRSMKQLGLRTRGPGVRSPEHHWNYQGANSTHSEYFGPNWTEQRRRAKIQDQARCQRCGMTESEHYEEYSRAIHVHHITKRREFVNEDGEFDYQSANALANLITLCFSCHAKVERWGVELDRR